MTKILSRLRGGDRRSIGNVSEVVAAVRKKPDLLKGLVAGLFDEDPVVRMRAADAMEKVSLEIRNLYSLLKLNSFGLRDKRNSRSCAGIRHR